MKPKTRFRAKAVKTLISIFCLISIISTTNVAFALQGGDGSQTKSDRVAYQVENLVGNDDMIDSIHEGKTNYVPSTTNVEISIPKEGDDKISLSIGDDDICMSLPDEIKKSEGVLTEDGYVVYDSQSNIDAIVQTTEEVLNSDEIRNTVRTMISIESGDASKEYSFDYDLPDGCRLVMGSELENKEIPDDAVGIINGEGYAIGIIDSPWAKDVTGEALSTSYRLEGNKLIQTINFNENTKFPVTADPSTIVDSKTRSTTYQKVTGWEEVDGQPSGGYVFRTGGSVGWYYGVGSSKSMSVEAQLTKGSLMVNFKLGIAKTSSSGTLISVNFPASTKAKKIIAKHHLNVTEKCQDYKYRNTKITNNGKNKETTYQWVTVRSWIDKVTETRPEYNLKVV